MDIAKMRAKQHVTLVTGHKAPLRPPPACKPKPPVVGSEQVACACGHEAVLEHFADKQDKFRDARRKKLAGRPCPACRQEAERQRVEAAKVAKAARAAKPNRGLTPAQRDARMDKQGRLPDRSTFFVRYDAGSQTWAGQLDIVTMVFYGTASGVFRLLRDLDQQYRDWLARQPAAAPTGAP